MLCVSLCTQTRRVASHIVCCAARETQCSVFYTYLYILRLFYCKGETPSHRAAREGATDSDILVLAPRTRARLWAGSGSGVPGAARARRFRLRPSSFMTIFLSRPGFNRLNSSQHARAPITPCLRRQRPADPPPSVVQRADFAAGPVPAVRTPAAASYPS